MRVNDKISPYLDCEMLSLTNRSEFAAEGVPNRRVDRSFVPHGKARVQNRLVVCLSTLRADADARLLIVNKQTGAGLVVREIGEENGKLPSASVRARKVNRGVFPVQLLGCSKPPRTRARCT